MGKRQSRWAGGLVNLALIVLVLAAMVLLYAFVTQTFFPEAGSEPVAIRAGAPAETEILQVEVRNGCGVAGLARRATEYLRDHGFDVVGSGNYSSFDQEHSVVIDRVGDLEAARRVAAALGIPDEHVRQEISQDYYLDASVIIGADYRRLVPFAGEAAEREE